MDDGVQIGTQTRSVVGVLGGEAVDALLGDLSRLGLRPEDISVMTRDAATATPVAETATSAIGGSAATGAAFGGLLGGLAGWMVSIGAIAIPGILVPGVGSIFGAGVLAATLTGLAVGAAAGGLAGALLGLGVPEEEARQYQDYLQAGSTIITVHPHTESGGEQIIDLFHAHGAHDVRAYEASPSVEEFTTPEVETAEMQEHDISPPVENMVSTGGSDAPAPRIVSRVHRVPAPVAGLPAERAQDETVGMGSGAAGGYEGGEARAPVDVMGEPPSGGTSADEDPQNIQTMDHLDSVEKDGGT